MTLISQGCRCKSYRLMQNSMKISENGLGVCESWDRVRPLRSSPWQSNMWCCKSQAKDARETPRKSEMSEQWNTCREVVSIKPEWSRERPCGLQWEALWSSYHASLCPRSWSEAVRFTKVYILFGLLDLIFISIYLFPSLWMVMFTLCHTCWIHVTFRSL